MYIMESIYFGDWTAKLRRWNSSRTATSDQVACEFWTQAAIKLTRLHGEVLFVVDGAVTIYGFKRAIYSVSP